MSAVVVPEQQQQPAESALAAPASSSAVPFVPPALHAHLDPRRRITRAVPGRALVHQRKLLNEEGRELTPCEAHLRRARHRDYKEEFLPRDRFEGPKDGYVFTTGANGTGYYLDATTLALNEPDADGYVLVHTAPAVAVHRAALRRAEAGKQGLLFSSKLLDALGPPTRDLTAPSDAVDTSPRRYALATPPWLCAMRPPPETLEQRGESMLDETVHVRNELLVEKLAYLRDRIDRVERGVPRDVPKNDDEGAVAVVVAEKAALTFHGDALLPADLPADGRWCLDLAFGGAGAADRPLAFRATLDVKAVQRPVAKLLAVFAKRHAAKYGDDGENSATPPLDPARLRLFVDADRYADPHTLVAELLDLGVRAPGLAGSFVVRRCLGAGARGTMVAYGRAAAIAERRETQVDDWSTHTDVLRARAKKPAPEKPMTSAEIRAYWDDRKHEKHWRTDAALKGYTTGTEDRAKLDAWSTTLKPRRGFLCDDTRDKP